MSPSWNRWLDPSGALLGEAFPLPLSEPFTRSMAGEAGISTSALRGLLGAGLLRTVLHGVHIPVQAADTVALRARALSLVVSEHAVVTDRAAAWLHGMPVLRRGAHLTAPPIEVCHVTDTRSRRPQVDGYRRGLLPRDVLELHGIRVTTPMRSALDLGRLLWRFDALASLDAALRVGVDHGQLLGEIGRFKGYRGVRQLRVLAPLADGRSESPGESALRLHWLDAGLPPPDLQYWIDDDAGVPLYRLDVPSPEVRYAAEYDGEQFHTEAADVTHDEERRDWIRTHRCWQIDAFTKQDVYGVNTTIGERLAIGFTNARRSVSIWTP
ncbi:MAG: type IV toxin-antitoxin system AbiEi family antitoxin domain-containing protein [Marmoricola sp.]